MIPATPKAEETVRRAPPLLLGAFEALGAAEPEALELEPEDGELPEGVEPPAVGEGDDPPVAGELPPEVGAAVPAVALPS